MKILFFLSYYHPYMGGAEHLFRQLAEGLVSRGHTVKVITTRLPGTTYSETLNGVDIQRIQVPGAADRLFYTLLADERTYFFE